MTFLPACPLQRYYLCVGLYLGLVGLCMRGLAAERALAKQQRFSLEGGVPLFSKLHASGTIPLSNYQMKTSYLYEWDVDSLGRVALLAVGAGQIVSYELNQVEKEGFGLWCGLGAATFFGGLGAEHELAALVIPYGYYALVASSRGVVNGKLVRQATSLNLAGHLGFDLSYRVSWQGKPLAWLGLDEAQLQYGAGLAYYYLQVNQRRQESYNSRGEAIAGADRVRGHIATIFGLLHTSYQW